MLPARSSLGTCEVSLSFLRRVHGDLHPVEQRFAPHFHLYIERLEGTELRHDGNNGGEIWDWARKAWWEIVRSDDPNHRQRGVHVRPCFYSPEEESQTGQRETCR